MASISWLRRLPKARVYILSAIVLLSVILVGFAYIYGQNIENAPVQDVVHVNQAAFIFYLITMPAISIIHVIAEFLFFVFLCPWNALIQLIISTTLALGWLTQGGFWMDCEVMLPNNDSVPRYCPQSPLKNGGTDRYGGEAVAKNVAVWVAFVLYVIHTIMAAISFHYARRRKASPEQEEDSEQFANLPKNAAFERGEERTYSGWDQHH